MPMLTPATALWKASSTCTVTGASVAPAVVPAGWFTNRSAAALPALIWNGPLVMLVSPADVARSM